MRYFMTFAYDGSKYKGYQKQPKCITVQGEIEKALKTINGGKKVNIHASGRTDAGVHAYNQKAHFDLEMKHITPEKLKDGINSLIPKDIYIINHRRKIALLTNPNSDKHKVLDSLVGIILGKTTLVQIKNDRLRIYK